MKRENRVANLPGWDSFSDEICETEILGCPRLTPPWEVITKIRKRRKLNWILWREKNPLDLWEIKVMSFRNISDVVYSNS